MGTVHLDIHIKFLLRRFNDKQLGELYDMNGKEVRKQLQELIDKGDIYIDLKSCPHFDPKFGCQCANHEDE